MAELPRLEPFTNSHAWLHLLPVEYWDDLPENGHGLALFEGAVRTRGGERAIMYFDRALSFSEVDRLSDRLAAELLRNGFAPGDRLAVFMQNIPAFYIGMIAAWKAGGAFVPINPMNRSRELAIVLDDAQPHSLILEPDLFDVYDALLLRGQGPRLVLAASPHDFASEHGKRWLPEERIIDRVGALSAVINATPAVPPAPLRSSAADAAFLSYTSGTTGVPKAAEVSHRAAALAGAYVERWWELGDDAPLLAMAPLFHTTGLMMTLMSALHLRVGLVLTYRFHPEAIVDAIRRYRPSMTAGTPTAYLALSQAPGVGPDDFTSFRACGIGGATVSPALKDRLAAQLNAPILPGYGMTETSGPVSMVPHRLHGDLPVLAESNALSIGIPLPGVDMWIAGAEGERLPPGQIGEIIVAAPGLMSRYWQRQEATAEAMPDGALRTGDVGVMNEEGWFFLIDRKKEMIVSGGFKVWPREIEDVLMGHDAIDEVAVLGLPDTYRGEAVTALVRLRNPGAATIDDIRRYCALTMAAYKRPREIRIVDELPKTGSGKIDRVALKAQAAAVVQ